MLVVVNHGGQRIFHAESNYIGINTSPTYIVWWAQYINGARFSKKCINGARDYIYVPSKNIAE
jgi:hypothetical protein